MRRMQSTLLDRPLTEAAGERLKPYVPRLLIEWMQDTPEARYRAIDGSLVFVDISGFTALTERLARRGKVGAEIMRDTLDGVFTALLDEAYDWGAGLLKWGGDALLLLFDGPLHAERAARACWEMQKTLDRVGRLRVGGGTIVLRMSIGISTGTMEFVVAGSVHRELLIVGRGATETVTIEAIADAGEIGLSRSMAAALDPVCVGPVKEEALLLVAPPDVERDRAPDVGSVRHLDIASCIPVAARAHVLLDRSEPEHRTITAAFIDMMDTDELLERLGPDAFAEALGERICAIEEAALKYEVPFYETDVGKGSVKALLTAGAPSSTGHDEERILRALREIMDQPGIVPMRIGVNTGKVFTGDFGPPYRRAYRVFGDAINTAARVMSRAEPGQVLATEIVLNRSRTTFETTPIEPFKAKGKAQRVHASIVGPVLGTRDARRAEVALVGRQAELGALLGVMDDVRNGNGWIIELAGEAGVGKSRLVEELIEHARDGVHLHTRCEEYEAATPYFALRTPMRTVLGLSTESDSDEVESRLREVVARVDPSLEPWIPLLALLFGLYLPHTPQTRNLDARFLREQLADVAMRFLVSTLAGTPTMLAVEDVHFMDEASADLLARFSRAGSGLRQVLLVTHSHPGERWAPADADLRCLSMCLLPLPASRMVELVESLTEDDPLSPHDVEEIARRSGGNALFLFELLDAVRATGSIDSLPDSVESLVAGEIDRLSPADRTVLRYASVLGASFDPDLLSAAASAEVALDPDVWSRLAELVNPEANGLMRFRNTLIRDTAYEGLPYRRRRVLHERAGNAIESRAGSSLDEELGALALHFHEAQRFDKAWTYCRQAGDRAKRIFANVDAAKFYERAATAGRRLRSVTVGDLAAVYELLGDVRYLLGEHQRADDAFKAARRLLGPGSADSGRLALKQAKLSTRQGNYQTALRRVTRALKGLDRVPGPEAAGHRARLYVWYGWIRFNQDRPLETIVWCRRGEQAALEAGARDALAQAYQFLDPAYDESGQIEQAVYSARALEIYEELGDLWQQAITLNNMGVTAKALSRWNDSRTFYDRALRLFETTGDRTMGCLAKYNIAELLSDQGIYDEAEPLLREVVRIWRASGADTDAAEAQRELGKLLARRGDLLAARELMESARAEQVQAGQQSEVLTTDFRFAELLVLSGDSSSALELTEELLPRCANLGATAVWAGLLRVSGWALLQSGRVEEARERLEEARTVARDRGDLFEECLSLEALAALGEIAGERAGGRDEALEHEFALLRERLGIVALPRVPRVPPSAVVST